MEHSSHLHPEFGLLSPTPRLRREIRIAVTSLLFGVIAGAICVSAVVALRHAVTPALVEASSAPLPQETKPGTEPGVAHANDAGTATSRASAEAPTQQSGETSAQAAAPPPPSAIAPKTRVVRIRRAVDRPAVARLPLGRSEAPAAASPPGGPSELSQTSNAAAPAGNEVAAVATEKPVARSGAKESVAASPPPKKPQRTVRNASSRRNYIENDPWLRDERQDDWRARAAAVNDARNPVGRANARDATSSFRGFWDWSR